MTIVVHVDTIFTVGEKTRFDQFRRYLNQMVPVKSLGELRWCSGCFYERDVGNFQDVCSTVGDRRRGREW